MTTEIGPSGSLRHQGPLEFHPVENKENHFECRGNSAHIPSHDVMIEIERYTLPGGKRHHALTMNLVPTGKRPEDSEYLHIEFRTDHGAVATGTGKGTIVSRGFTYPGEQTHTRVTDNLRNMIGSFKLSKGASDAQRTEWEIAIRNLTKSLDNPETD